MTTLSMTSTNLETRATGGPMPRLPRGRRTVAAVLVALVLLLLAGFAAWQAVLVQAGQQPTPLDAAAISSRLNQTAWSDPAVLVAGTVLVVLGLWLLVVAFIPPRRKLVELREEHPDVVTGIHPADLRRALNGAAERVDGITTATTSLTRSVAAVRVASPLGDPAGLVDAVTESLADQLDQLNPVEPLTPRVTLTEGNRR